jgi:catechol 2,3-dioxygenase-like lactoylglutathione lyase family enzyme
VAATVTGTAVVRLDHGVVSTNDVGQTLDFLVNVLGARFERLVSVNLRGLHGEVPMMAFTTLANHEGFGIALQHVPIPAPIRPLEGHVWGFETDERGVAGVADELRQRGVAFEGPVEHPAPSPIAASLFVRDPSGNVYEICERRDAQRRTDAGQGPLGLRRISHVRAEVTDLEAARDWYTRVLELDEDVDPVPGDRQFTLSIRATGQLFVLHEVDALTQRSLFTRGQHIDVRVPVGAYDTVVARIEKPERYQGPEADRIPWPEATRPTLYFYDPFNNRLQISEHRTLQMEETVLHLEDTTLIREATALEPEHETEGPELAPASPEVASASPERTTHVPGAPEPTESQPASRPVIPWLR